MKIRSDRAPLADAVAWVAQAIPKNSQAPALSGMKLSATDGALTLQAFDYDVSHTATLDGLDVIVASEGECLVSGKFVREIVGSLKGKAIELVLDSGQLTISAGRASYRTRVLNLGDFPHLPKRPAEVGKISGAALAAMVASVRHPIDDGTPHPQVRGLHVEGDGDGLTVVGASRFCVAEHSAMWERKADFAATVHSGAFTSALKGLDGSLVSIGSEGGMVGLWDESRAVTLRTYSDEFVAWRRLVRGEADDRIAARFDPAELLDAAKRAAQLDASTDRSMPLVLAFAAAEVGIEVAGQEYAEGSDAIDAECTGEQRLAVSPRYLIDTLAAIPSGLVSVGLVDHRKPLVFRPVDHDRMVTVLMPRTIPGEH